LKIEAVITSVGYGDFLRWTLPFCRTVFDRLVVVTSPEDRQTPRACAVWNVECLESHAFHQDGAAFAKGKGINAGLEALALDDWVVHLDADIALPAHARAAFERAQLDPACVYGIDRVDCKGFDRWVDFLCEGDPQILYDLMVAPGPFGFSFRVLRPAFDGWVPIGFFQMWHPGATGIRRYPEYHTDAARGDVLFAAHWPRSRRQLIPEVLAYHLESERAPVGTNWSGRRTKPFDRKSRALHTAFAPIDYTPYEVAPEENSAAPFEIKPT
jgi:hypothetical protein